VGDGPDRARLEAAVRAGQLSHRVRFTGALNQPEVRAELTRADAFVLPSLAEGIPVVLMEAMASGLPCVTTPVNGIPELIEHGRSGLLATPGCVVSLKAQLRRVMADEGLRLSVAQAGRAQVERAFRLDMNVAKLAAILRSLPGVTAHRAVGAFAVVGALS